MELQTAEEAKKAVSLNGQRLRGRKIFVQQGSALVEGTPHLKPACCKEAPFHA